MGKGGHVFRNQNDLCQSKKAYYERKIQIEEAEAAARIASQMKIYLLARSVFCASKNSGSQRRQMISRIFVHACLIFGSSHFKCINVKSRISTNFISGHFRNDFIPPVICWFPTSSRDCSKNTHHLPPLQSQSASPSKSQTEGYEAEPGISKSFQMIDHNDHFIIISLFVTAHRMRLFPPN